MSKPDIKLHDYQQAAIDWIKGNVPATVTIETKDLTGAALDWAVAKAEGELPMHIRASEPHLWNEDHSYGYSPSTDWSQAGPIIEREVISLIGPSNHWPDWRALYDNGIGASAAREVSGETPLIAAMRCYVASKLGASVEVPVELVEVAA